MDCEACTEKMIELLYEELDEADRETTEGHLASCEACAQAYARLESGLAMAARMPIVEPGADVLADVLALARDRGAERDRVSGEAPALERATAVRDEAEGEPGLWETLVHWVGGFAMRPQLAMAMTLLLMVGMGLWYLPEMRDADPTDSHAVIDPTLDDEVSPSATLEPAELLELRADPRTGRIRPLDSEVAETLRDDAVEDHDETAGIESSGNDGLDNEAPELAVAEVSPVVRDLPAQESGVDPTYHPRSSSAEPSPSASSSEGMARADELTSPERETADTPAPDDGAAVAVAANPAREQFDRGLTRYRQRDYRGAADDFDAVIRRPEVDAQRLMPQALHQLARSHRGGGNCQTAVATYEQLLSRYQTYSGAPDAMIEAGDCYRRLGRLSDARRWYTEAQRHQAVASRARRAMTTLATAERAHDDAVRSVPARTEEAASEVDAPSSAGY